MWIQLNFGICPLSFFIEDNKVTEIHFQSHSKAETNRSLPFLATTIQQELNAYKKGERTHLIIPHQLNATAFQTKVLMAIQAIPLGETRSYKDIARLVSSHPRAVGQALKRNPLPLIYPCHRVTSQSGLGGFVGKTSGEMVSIKQSLLLHEKAGLKPAFKENVLV